MAEHHVFSAKSLYQKHIDIVTVLFWRRDWEALPLHLEVPGFLQTPETAPQRIDSHADLLERVAQKRAMLDEMDVTDYHRICEAAEFTDPARTKIEGRHRTFVLQRGVVLLDPYLCEMPLVLRDGVWKSAGYRTSLRNGDFRAAPRSFAYGLMTPAGQSPVDHKDQGVTKA